MASKVKRQFLIAVEGHPEWLQAVAWHELRGRKPEFHVERVLEGAENLSSSSYMGLLAQGVRISSAVKKELVAALTTQMIRDPDVINEIIDDATESECRMRSRNLLLDVLDRLYDQYGENGEEKLEDLDFLRSLPDSDYGDTKYFQPIAEWLAILHKVRQTVNDGGKTEAEKKAVIEPLLSNWPLTPFLFGLADRYGFDYGDGPNDYDGPSRKEIKVRFDTVKSLMRNWAEVAKAPKEKTYDSFTVGEKPRRRVYVRRDFVTKKIT